MRTGWRSSSSSWSWIFIGTHAVEIYVSAVPSCDSDACCYRLHNSCWLWRTFLPYNVLTHLTSLRLTFIMTAPSHSGTWCSSLRLSCTLPLTWPVTVSVSSAVLLISGLHSFQIRLHLAVDAFSLPTIVFSVKNRIDKRIKEKKINEAKAIHEYNEKHGIVDHH